MSKLSEIINELKNESSTNAKQAILEKNKSNEDLKALFYATYDPMINYYLRGDAVEIDVFDSVPDTKVEFNASVIGQVVKNLNGRVVTGHAARNYIKEVSLKLTDEDRELLRRMINHDMECKVSEGLINRVWDKLIKNYPCLLASKYDEKTDKKIREKYKGKFIAQLKADGGRVNAHVQSGVSTTFYSRNGNLLLMHGVFDTALSDFDGYVLDGELLVLEGGSIQNRQTGNGIFNKAVRNTITKDEAETFHFVVWDMIPIESFKLGIDKTPYKERFKKLSELVEKNTHNLKISLIESKEFDTIDECLNYAEEKIIDGQEGAIIKMEPLYWEDNRSKDQIKIKEEKSGDFLCVGVKPHSKRSELVGSLDFESSDGKISFNCGSGLLDEDRKLPWDYFVGKIFEVQYNALIKGKDSDVYRLFLPVKPRVRLDKDRANTLEELK